MKTDTRSQWILIIYFGYKPSKHGNTHTQLLMLFSEKLLSWMNYIDIIGHATK